MPSISSQHETPSYEQQNESCIFESKTGNGLALRQHLA